MPKNEGLIIFIILVVIAGGLYFYNKPSALSNLPTIPILGAITPPTVEQEGYITYDDFTGIDDYTVQYENIIVVKDAFTCIEGCSGTQYDTDSNGCPLYSLSSIQKVCDGGKIYQCNEYSHSEWNQQWCGQTFRCHNYVGCDQEDVMGTCKTYCGGSSTIPYDYEMGVSSQFTTSNNNELILPDDTKMVYLYPKGIETMQINGVSKSITNVGSVICVKGECSALRYGRNSVTYQLFDYKNLDNSLLHYGTNTIISTEPMEFIIQHGKCRGTWSSSCGSTYPSEINKARDTWWCPSSSDTNTYCNFDKWINVPSTGKNSGSNLKFTSGGKSLLSGISTFDFKEFDIQVVYQGSTSVSLVVLENNDLIKQKVIKTYPITNLKTDNVVHILKMKHSAIYPSRIAIENDGFDLGTLDIPEDNIHIQIGANIHSISYKPQYGCVQSSQELLGVETFNAGTIISKFSTRYAVTRFCYEHLPIITKQSGSTIDKEIMPLLIQGGEYTVKSDETVTLFYVFYNDGSIPMACTDEFYDIDNNRCTDLTGVVMFCSEGTFSPDIGACVITPEQKILCPEGGRYDTAQAICIWNPPIQAVCEIGDYNSVTGKCEVPTVLGECEEGIYNPLSKFCEVFPLKTIYCEAGYTYNPLIDKCCDGDNCVDTVSGVDQICTQGTLYQNPETLTYSCIIAPDYQTGTCISGKWNEEMNACVITPNMQYLCINGVLNEDNTACLITPTITIICPEGSVYDEITEKCLKNVPGSEVVTLCPENSNWNSVLKKCVHKEVDVIFCEESEIFNSLTGQCEKKFKLTSPEFPITPVLIGLGVIILLFIIFKKR